MIQAIVGEFKKPAVVNLFLYIYIVQYIFHGSGGNHLVGPQIMKKGPSERF